jgi:hypothetical protein
MARKDKSLKSQLSMILGAVAMIVCVAILARAVLFQSGPNISPGIPDTSNSLICSWNASDDTTQINVSWYVNGILVFNETPLDNKTSTLGPAFTTRGDVINCTVTLSNGTGAISQTTNVTIANAPPSEPNMTNLSGVTVENATTVIEDMVNNFTIASSDPDGDKVTYGSFDILPDRSSLNPSTGVFSWNPEEMINADTNITFYARDNQTPFKNTNKFVIFRIMWVNDAPVFNPNLTNQTIKEGDVFNYEVSATDEEGNLPLNWTIATSPNLSLVINSTGPSSAMVMFTGNRSAAFTEANNYSVNVTVYDNLSASTISSFWLKINQTNADPILDLIPNYTGTQGQPFNFTVHATDVDVNDTLNFSIEAVGCPLANPWTIETTNSSHNATGLVNISSLINDHVACNHIRIVIYDTRAEDSQDVFLNISNTNDPPIVEVLSSFSNNTEGQQNISSLHAYGESNFLYKVNGTDPDNLTYAGDILTYSDNSTLFNINSSTGIISFMPTQGEIANYSINITVVDLGGLSHSRLMSLEIRNNSAPVLSPVGNLTCFEDVLCMEVTSATDVDGDNLTFTSTNTTLFGLTNNLSAAPVWSAYTNYTPLQAQVGSYAITVTVTDIKGASDTESFVFSISNTNDIPLLADFEFPRLVETHTVIIPLTASDEDYLLPSSYEYVNFSSTNMSGRNLFNASTLWNNATSMTYGRIIVTPQIGDPGNYSVNVSATDFYGAVSWRIKNFTVLAKSLPPNITQIRPYGWPYILSTVFSLTNTSNFNTSATNIEFSENTTVLYNITVTDDLTALQNLTYEWRVNDSLVGTNSSFNITYSFFSAGTYNLTATVFDDMYENSTWTWHATVDNYNRAPLLVNQLENLTVNGTETFVRYFMNSPVTHFLDPDDDLDSDNSFDANETTHLTHFVNNCSVAMFIVNNQSLTVKPFDVGYCDVVFTATDPDGLTKMSNTVRINATMVSNDSTETPQPTPTSSGGGGGRSNSAVVMPMRREETKPQAIEIVVPDLVTVYENRTVRIPIMIHNNWNSTLKGITLNASTDAKDVHFTFSKNTFEELKVGEQRNISLFVDNYRMGEDYKIKITANVTNPKTGDAAYVMMNTIEQSKTGNDVETKVTFAQDLLNKNPECLELNELLEQAKQELDSGSRTDASKMVEGVIEGCKYLVSISKKAEQKPDTLITKAIQKENLKYIIIFAVAAGLIVVTLVSAKKMRRKTLLAKKADDEQQKKKEETEFKPYWEGQQ